MVAVPKGGRTTAQLRRARSRSLLTRESRNKNQVRTRDGFRCRFPDCPCYQVRLFLEVSHQTHKGMGGDPTGERSQPERMMLVCNWRHKESPLSIDKERLRWRELLEGAGSNGPVAWDVRPFGDDWTELAREIRPGVIDRQAMTSWQGECLEALSDELLGNARKILGAV